MNRPAHRVDADPTLSVAYLDGGVAFVGVRQALSDAHLIADISTATPPGYAQWRRTLAVFVYRVTGLDADLPVLRWRRQRDDLWRAGQFDASFVDAYCNTWAHRLDLFDSSRPWLQVADLVNQSELKPVAEILAYRPSGVNEATLFSPFHDGLNAAVSPVEAAEAMLVALGHSAGGLMPNRTLPGQAPRKTGFTSPQRASVNYLPVGRSLFHSLVAGLVAPVTLPLRSPEEPDLAEWERDVPDPYGSRPEATGIISLLSAQSQRAMLLEPSEDGSVAQVRSTWKYAQNAGAGQAGSDPFTGYRKRDKPKPDENPLAARRATMNDGDSAITEAWRELPSLVPTSEARVSNLYAPPGVVEEATTLPPSGERDSMKFSVCLWRQDPGKAINGGWLRSDTPDIHVALWTTPDDNDHPGPEQWRLGIARWVEACTSEWGHLSTRLRTARRQAFDIDKSKRDQQEIWAKAVRSDFWAAAYDAFTLAISADTARNAEEFVSQARDAKQTLRCVALDLYDRATVPYITSRSVRAIVTNRPHARMKFADPTESPDPEQENTPDE